MALNGYGVLVGTVVDKKVESGQQTPHYQIHIRASGVDYRIAVNVRSAQNPPDLLYFADEAFTHPILSALAGLGDGFHPVASTAGGAALDYIRGNLFDHTAMRTLPANLTGADNDLSDKIDHFIARALANPDARVYAFGQRWGPESAVPDKVFGFRPGNGIHDIHMNQGNSGTFVGDDGVWQDGGLLIHYPAQPQWVGFFLAFQSQAWHTDDTTGHTIPVGPEPEPGPGPGPQPAGADRQVRIVAALVNPTGPAPEVERVTLLNRSPDPIDLTGWSIADRLKRRFNLPAQLLAAGETVQVTVQAPTALGNDGGLITLLNADGLKVDGVAYTKNDASEGWSTVF